MNDDEQKTLNYLKAFVPRPAPSELKQKVLAAARASRSSDRFLTSIQWEVAVVCVLLIIGALAGDSILSWKQARRLDALDDRPPAAFMDDADRSALEELVGADGVKHIRLQLTRFLRELAYPKEGRID